MKRTTEIVATFAFAFCVACESTDNKNTTSGVDAAAGVAPADKTPAAQAKQAALTEVKTYVTQNLDDLHQAAKDLQTAAPVADDDGWNNNADRAAVDSMKAAWRRARRSYERVEGAIAVLFPELDRATDERYDGFLEDMADLDLFDGQGVTGVHAIERILWADQTRTEVIEFEKPIKGYKAAAFPRTKKEAEDFKSKLAAALVADVGMMRDMFKPLALDPEAAYRGVIGSVEEQIEKVSKAETGEEESRYANETLADMRYNVEGGIATHQAFRPWRLTTKDGAALDGKILAGFKRLNDAYGSDAELPPVPSTWNAAKPSAADLATPFGKTYSLVKKESDDKDPESLVSAMNVAAAAMGIRLLP